MEWEKIDRYAKSLIKEAGHLIRHSFLGEIHIDTKADANDLVTNIDKAIEQFFISRIKSDFPEDRILGEEGFGDHLKSLEGKIWLLDPIDGTMNFVHQKRNFAISLGIYQDGVGMLGYIYDVVHDELYSARKGGGAYINDERIAQLTTTSVSEAVIGLNARWITPNRHIDQEKIIQLVQDSRGMRGYGSAALELAYVATGRLDAYISMQLSPWDIAGGMVIVQEVGAIVTNLKGQPASLLKPDSFVTANPLLHQALLENYLSEDK